MALEHRVRQGECLASIAARYGLPSAEALFDHPDNAALKRRRKHPGVLSPGDVVKVPEREAGELSCGTGREHVFRVKVPKRKLVVRVGDGADGFLEGKRYEVRVGGALLHEGHIPGGGTIEHELEPGVTSALLLVFVHDDDQAAELVYPLEVGHLDPHDALSGVRARLANLGYGPLSRHDGELDDDTREALRAFQRKHRLDETGEPDDATRAKLDALHAGDG
jgi:hypothetical protein